MLRKPDRAPARGYPGPAGRRRRAIRAVLLALTCAWVALAVLIVAGFTSLHRQPGPALARSAARRDEIGASTGLAARAHRVRPRAPSGSSRPGPGPSAGAVARPPRGCSHARACAGRGCARAAGPVTSRSFGSVAAAFSSSGVAPPGDVAAGNFDCRGFSFDARQLTADGFGPGDPVAADGGLLTLPRVASGAPDEVTAAGQVIRPGGGMRGRELGFLGAGEFGVQQGTVTITYAGGSTQRSRLRLADWYADSAAPGSVIAASAPWNVPPGHAARFGPAPVAVYYAQIPVSPARVITSVRLPVDANMHLFDVGVPAAARFGSVSLAFDDTALAPAGAARYGNFDGAGHSYDAGALAAAGLRPGARVTARGVHFTWPGPGPGRPDNVRAEGQDIAVAGSGRVLGFLGAAAGRARTGTVTIHYTDGTAEPATLTLASWQARHAAAGGSVVATVPRNQAGGPGGPRVSVYSAAVPLRAGKTVAYVTLPVDFGLHLFAIAEGR